MPAVFHCPYCEKQYPKKSSLIGRKVRCSDCKNIFALQGDGTVLKVDQEGQGAATNKAGTGSSKHQVTRQLTRRNKRVDVQAVSARIEQSRSSLRDAAQAALSGAQKESVNERQDKKQSGAQRKEIEIYRSKQQAPNPLIKFISFAVMILLLIVAIIALLPEETPQQRALTHFASLVEQDKSKYPLRMLEYRKRMWVYSRDGQELPEIILNADKSEMGELQELPWQRLSDICQKHFGGMSSMPFFAIMAESEKQAMVEQMWEDYNDKNFIEGFYRKLKQAKIQYIHFRKIPELLKSESIGDREAYIISLLLAGTSDQQGSPCSDFGLMSSIKAQSAFICEFSGSGGLKLVERANDYEVLGATDFCGIILGFSGIPGREDQWRVLDVRPGKNINKYYDQHYNPFSAITVRVSDYIKRNYLSIEDQKTLNQQNTAGAEE